MPRHTHLRDDELVAFLVRRRRSASLREIIHEMRLAKKQRHDVEKAIERLLRRGDVVEESSGRYGLPSRKGKEEKRTADSHAKPHKGRHPGGRQKAAPQKAGREAGLILGRIVVHRDGYGFVVPAQPIPGVEGDLFIGRDKLADAMHGDHVAARVERRSPDRRAEGRVVRVEKRAHPSVVGVFHYGSQGNYVEPYDQRLLTGIIIPPGDELTPEMRAKLGPAAAGRNRVKLPELDGAVVNVELTRYPASGVAPAGRVVEILGAAGDFGIDVEIVIRKHHLPHEFPGEVLDDASRVPQQVPEADTRGREDFRALPIVTIDGETAKDFDDAVHVRRLDGDQWELQVHIADVAHYVPRGSPLDLEARLRGTSVYFPDRAVPMLPEALSNGICSLNPNVDRLVMSVVMVFDAQGHVVAERFTSGVIRSAERMTYTNVNKVLEGDAEMSARYADQAEHFRRMRELALLLNDKRTRRGSIDFDLPEPVIEFDELGRMVKIVRSERNIANRIIEEFMLAANEAVARHLERRGIASLHRVHEKPDAKKVLEFEDLARAFGYTLGVADLAEKRMPVKHGRVRAAAHGRGRGKGGRERQMTFTLPGGLDLDIRPQHYQRLTQKIAGHPEERILSYLMLRSLKQARYEAEPLGHFALACDEYTHFTSPIRRYPDLIVHRILKWALENPQARAGQASRPVHKDKKSPPAALGPYSRVELEETAEESSDAERRADAAERELMDWKTARFMEKHLGEEFDAIITSILKFGFFVELLDIFVEGMVPIETLEEVVGERCLFRDRDRVIRSEHGRVTFRLGDKVRVRADRVDKVRMRVEFALVEHKKNM
ncbi:MAG TPA: VacB/RNase II family 3'-5' exoribonuclease [Candidatus Acidoferrales bacterium]